MRRLPMTRISEMTLLFCANAGAMVQKSTARAPNPLSVSLRRISGREHFSRGCRGISSCPCGPLLRKGHAETNFPFHSSGKNARMVLSCLIWELMLRRMTGKIGTPSLQPKSNCRSFVLESRFYSNPGGGDQPEPRIDGGAAPEEPEILHQLSSSAWIANPLSAALQRISSRLGLQQTWQSSTYC